MHCYRSHRRAFSLIELLIVIGVITLLIALIGFSARGLLERQKVRNTQQTMQQVLLAIDAFQKDNPLRGIYDLRDGASFANFPPYQIARPAGSSFVSAHQLFEPPAPQIGNPRPAQPNGFNGTLTDRFERDLLNENPNGSVPASRLTFNQSRRDKYNDDIRALYTYLAVFENAAVKQISPAALQPLGTDDAFINTGLSQGGGTAASVEGRRQILGIVDAWGVPLDYMLYVRFEKGQPIERRALLRSRGVDRDRWNALVTANKTTDLSVTSNDPTKWIWSEPVPGGWANVDPNTGGFNVPVDQVNGWVRMAPSGATNAETDAVQYVDVP